MKKAGDDPKAIPGHPTSGRLNSRENGAETQRGHGIPDPRFLPAPTNARVHFRRCSQSRFPWKSPPSESSETFGDRL